MAALDLGVLQLGRGDLRAAHASFVKARTLDAQDPVAYVAAATTALLLGRRAEALEAVAGAVKQNAGDPLVGLLDVLVRGTTSSPLTAATSPSVAASLYPDLERAFLPPDVLVELGPAPVAGRVAAASLLLQRWSPAAALGWLAAQTSAEPAGPLAEMTAIRALVAAGELQAARRRVARLEVAPAGRGLAGPSVQAAEVAARLDDPAGALRAMQRALAAAPDLPRLRMLAGDLYNALGQPDEAMTQYRAALQGLPGDARLLNQLAATIAAEGPRTQYEEALRLAEEGLRHRPHYLLRAYLLDTRADLLYRLGRTAEAYAAYRELSTTVGGITGPDAWHRLGELALAAGDLGDARRAFEEALDYGRDYPLRARAVEQVAALPASPPQK
jgi:tetratricopeptide (TPR) repeat protein